MGKNVQKMLLNSSKNKTQDLARSFANNMFEGKVTAAVRILCDDNNNGVLPLSEETMTQLKINTQYRLESEMKHFYIA